MLTVAVLPETSVTTSRPPLGLPLSTSRVWWDTLTAPGTPIAPRTSASAVEMLDFVNAGKVGRQVPSAKNLAWAEAWDTPRSRIGSSASSGLPLLGISESVAAAALSGGADCDTLPSSGSSSTSLSPMVEIRSLVAAMLSAEATARGLPAFSEPEARPTARSTAEKPSSGTLSTFARSRSTELDAVAVVGSWSGAALAAGANGTVITV